MSEILIAVSLFLAVSLTTNVFLFFKIKKKPRREQSIELKEFLADLLAGPAFVAVGRVDPDNLLLRSPKQK